MSSKQRSYPLTLRVMARADLPEILRIEADSFWHPWSEGDFVEHFENPDSVALVAEQSGLIVAYEVFGIGTPWIELHSCVVRREFRRQGVGSQMVASLARQVADGEGDGILTKIPEKNVCAQLFFRQCGFRAVRVLRAYLRHDQDVYVMEYSGRESNRDFASDISEDVLIPVREMKHD